MRFLHRALTGLFLLSLTIGLLAAAGLVLRGALDARSARGGAERSAEERVFAAAVVRVAPGRIVPELTTFGRVESRLALEVRAPVGGRVVELGPGVEEGGAVREGQLLFRIDPNASETALALVGADLQDAEAELADARRAVDLAADDLTSAEGQSLLRERALDRQTDLEGRGVGSAAAVETAELAVAAAAQAILSRRQALAEAEARAARAGTALSRARIALEEAERDVADTRVAAAFDGVLTDLSLLRGGLVASSERVADLIDPDALDVAFRVSTAEYARLRAGEGALAGRDVRVALDVSDLGIESPARITREGAAVGEGQTGRQLFARLERPEGFRAGDFVRVIVDEPALERVARLPAAAVSPGGEVLVLDGDDRLRAASVEILRREGDDVLVRAGGLADREVVAERSPLLGAGIRVRPVRPEPAAAPGPDDRAGMLELSDARRARLVAFVEGSAGMPETDKARVLAQLRGMLVSARVVARIERRMGG